MKKVMTSLAAITAFPVALFAQEQAGTNVTANVTAAANAVQGAVGDAANAAAPIIVVVIGIGVALWILPTIVGVIKRAFGAGKGR